MNWAIRKINKQTKTIRAHRAGSEIVGNFLRPGTMRENSIIMARIGVNNVEMMLLKNDTYTSNSSLSVESFPKEKIVVAKGGNEKNDKQETHRDQLGFSVQRLGSITAFRCTLKFLR